MPEHILTPQTPSTKSSAHVAFIVMLLGKCVLGLTQIAIAVAIYFGLAEVLPSLIQSFAGAELTEDPKDFIALRAMEIAGLLPSTNLGFYVLYFAAHGVLHVSVAAALFAGAAWAYPAAILVLGVFVVYQIFEYLAVGGPMLVILSFVDLVVIYLTLIEWRARSSATKG